MLLSQFCTTAASAAPAMFCAWVTAVASRAGTASVGCAPERQEMTANSLPSPLGFSCGAHWTPWRFGRGGRGSRPPANCPLQNVNVNGNGNGNGSTVLFSIVPVPMRGAVAGKKWAANHVLQSKCNVPIQLYYTRRTEFRDVRPIISGRMGTILGHLAEIFGTLGQNFWDDRTEFLGVRRPQFWDEWPKILGPVAKNFRLLIK